MPITKVDQNVFQPVLATGSTASRTLANRFADVVNVKDFLCDDGLPVAGDGIHDDTTGIQAALNSIPFGYGATNRSGVYFPRGIYIITNTLFVKTNYTGFFCDGVGSAEIRLTNYSVDSAILVKNPTAGGSIFEFSWRNVVLVRLTASTYQKGIVLESCSNTHMTDVEISGFPTCLDIRGGLNCHYTTIRLSDYGSTNTTPDVGLLQIDGSAYASNPVFFSHLFTNSLIGGGSYCLTIRGGDYITFSNTYFGGGKQGDVLIGEGTIYANYDNYFDNCYFDFAQQNFDTTRAAIAITGGGKNNTKITDSRFGPWGIGVKIDSVYDPAIEITGCLFQRTNTPVLMEATSQYTSLVLTGNQFRDSGFLGGNANCLEIRDATQITITGNSFYWDYAGWVAGATRYIGNGIQTVFNLRDASTTLSSAYEVLIDGVIQPSSSYTITAGNPYTITTSSPVPNGETIEIRMPGTKKVIAITSGATIENISITGNVFNSTPFTGVVFVDFENLGTVDQLVITGNASSNTTNTIVGHLIGNQLSSNPLMLDWYQEGVFTPVLSFGGASVGVTYTTQIGNYTRIGNRMIFDLQIQLSSKGSATGDVAINGFPFPLSPSGISTGNLSVSIPSVDGIGGANVDSYFNTTTSAIIRYIDGSGNGVTLTNSNFRNNTFLFLSGSVQVE